MFSVIDKHLTASDETLYVEDVFSAYTYTGTGANLDIVNGIDLAGEGGLVWGKRRNGAISALLLDTERGATNYLLPDATSAQGTLGTTLTAFNSDGFSLGSGSNLNAGGGSTNVAWTFRKAPRFFDVVTYTGNGANRTIPHSLGVVPGMIVIKRVDNTNNWAVYHRSLSNAQYLNLNETAAAAAGVTWWNSTSATDSVFSIGTGGAVNTSGGTYIAYLFAHDDSDEGIIQCGTYTGNGSATGPIINLGWEPQYVLIKRSNSTGSWYIFDTARGMTLNNDAYLVANTSSAEPATGAYINPTATGFNLTTSNSEFNGSSSTYVYMTIRKGNMRVPTDATKVFAINARTGTGGSATISGLSITNQPNLAISKRRSAASEWNWQDTLRGTLSQLSSSSTAAETTENDRIQSFYMDGVQLGLDATINAGSSTYINCFLRQAKGFLDIVGYIGQGSATAVAHNLGVVPDLMIIKRLVSTDNWAVYYGDNTRALYLSTTAASILSNMYWNNVTPTEAVFTVNNETAVNGSNSPYIAYLFASCPGVSKIGTYTGNAAVNQINCGFAAGARFVMIKRIDSTGDWYYWDSTRGIIAGNDPYLLMNSTAAEVTSTDYVDAYSAGFELSSTAPAALNASGGSFLYVAFA